MNRRSFFTTIIFSVFGWKTLVGNRGEDEWQKRPVGYTPNSESYPDLFLVGDSISIQYTPYLAHYLERVVAFGRKQDDGEAEQSADVPSGANSGDSGMVLAYLTARLKDETFRPDYLLLNCGLHDIKRQDDARTQVSQDNYRRNLRSIVDLLEDHDIRLIWIRTTPVINDIHNSRTSSFKRYAADVEQYNRIADEICSEQNISVIDLFGFTRKLGRDAFKDHVHYTEPVRKLQAAYIAGAVQSMIAD